MTAIEKTSDRMAWLSHAFLLALLPAVCYALAFSYEAGFSSHFGMPLGLVQINLVTVVAAFFSLLGTMFVFWLLADFLVYPVWTKLPEAIRPACTVYVYFFFILVVKLLIARGPLADLWPLLLLVFLFTLFNFLLPFLNRSDKREYREKLLSRFEEESRAEWSPLFQRIADSVGIDAYRLLFAILGLLWLAYSTGLGNARSKKHYPVLTNALHTAVVRAYGDTFVTVLYDAESKGTSKEFGVYRAKPGSNIQFVIRDIGPLRLDDQQN